MDISNRRRDLTIGPKSILKIDDSELLLLPAMPAQSAIEVMDQIARSLLMALVVVRNVDSIIHNNYSVDEILKYPYPLRMKTINALYIDDDSDMRNLVKSSLPENVTLSEAESVVQAVEAISSHSFDFIFIDLNLGRGGEGFQIIDFLKTKEFISIPTIFIVTGSAAEDDEIRGHQLDVGEYIHKPVKPKIFRAMVEKHIAHRESKANSVKKVGPLKIDEKKMQVKINNGTKDEDLLLTLKEYKLLMTFIDNPGANYSREELYKEVWDSSGEVQSRTIDMHVSALRKKLGEFGGTIISVRGVGYSFSPEKMG